MPNYLVRRRDSGTAVGLFAVTDLEDLVFWIDEVADPAECEYVEIGSGSVVWDRSAKRLPDPQYAWTTEPRPVLDVVGRHSLGGLWVHALTGDDLVFNRCIG